MSASWMQGEKSFQIKSLNDEHSCVKDWQQKLINSEWIANMLSSKIMENPTWHLLDMVAKVKKKYQTLVTPKMCYKAKRKVLDQLEGALKEHYGLLWRYSEELRRSNPGSTVRMMVNRPTEQCKPIFQRFYVCLAAVKQGWLRGCRRFIGLDGCFLETICKGQLLAAVGKDANNHIYPIAWAVVETETRESWSWFIELLLEDLGDPDTRDWTIMSDGQKGLIQALKDLLPFAEHRRCARHIYTGLRRKFNGVLMRNLFWQAAKSSIPQEFEFVMDQIKTESKQAYDYLTHPDRDPKSWSKAFFRYDCLVDNVENNLCECFNAFILETRRKPIITMLEEIRVLLMHRMRKMRELHDKLADPHDMMKVPRKRLEKNKENTRFWRVDSNGANGFEVKHGTDGYTVGEIDEDGQNQVGASKGPIRSPRCKGKT